MYDDVSSFVSDTVNDCVYDDITSQVNNSQCVNDDVSSFVSDTVNECVYDDITSQVSSTVSVCMMMSLVELVTLSMIVYMMI